MSVVRMWGRGVAVAVTTVLISAGFGTSSAYSAGISFSVAPDTNLVNGQALVITGSGVAPNSIVGAAECAPGTTDLFECGGFPDITPADVNGNFTLQVNASRSVSGVDCAAAACFIGVGSAPDTTILATHALTFDPNGPVPTIAVIPSTNLPFVSQVQVTGESWAPNTFGELEQCTADGQFCTPLGAAIDSDASGHADGSLYVRRQFNDGFSGTTDCTSYAGGCAVFAYLFDGTTLSTPISFDPSAVIPPPAKLIVTPRRGLTDHQIVAISGSGFVANSLGSVAQCIETEHFGSCSFQMAAIEPSGRLARTGIAVRRYMRNFGEDKQRGTRKGRTEARRTFAKYFGTTQERRMLSSGGRIDCAAKNVHCTIEYASQADGFISQELSFNPHRPPARAPRISARPTQALKDRQTIEVKGEGFAPGEFVEAVQCRGTAPFHDSCDGLSSTLLTANRSGQVRGKVMVHRSVGFAPHKTDCARHLCSLRVVGSDDRAQPITLRFDPGAPFATPPSLVITPSTGLVDGQSVAVTGSHFASHSLAIYGQCTTNGAANPTENDILGCVDTPNQTLTDAAGNFNDVLTVTTLITRFDGTVADCSQGAACVMFGFDIADITAPFITPLGFAG